MKNYILLFIFLIFIAGCNQANIKSSNLGINTLEAPVIYVAPNKTVLSKEYLPKDVAIILPTIPGQIFGNPSDEIIYKSLIKEDNNINLNLSESITILNNSSKPLLQKWSSMGLEVKPTNTKLSRIGTFAFDYLTGTSIGGGGFIDPLTKNTLILVYVNKACSIRGNLKLERESFEHNINFPSAGFHFVQVTEVKTNHYKLEYYPKGGIINFSIHLNNMVTT